MPSPIFEAVLAGCIVSAINRLVNAVEQCYGVGHHHHRHYEPGGLSAEDGSSTSTSSGGAVLEATFHTMHTLP